MGNRMGYTRGCVGPTTFPNHRQTTGLSTDEYLMEWRFKQYCNYAEAVGSPQIDVVVGYRMISTMRAQRMDIAWDVDTNRVRVGASYGSPVAVSKLDWIGFRFSYTLRDANE